MDKINLRLASFLHWQKQLSDNSRFSKICPPLKQWHELTRDGIIANLTDRLNQPYTGICPACQGRQTLRDPQRGEMYCICYLIPHYRKLGYELSEFASRITPKNLDNFKEWGVEVSKSQLKDAFIITKTWINTPTQWVFLSGGYGSGKSHLAQAAAAQLWPLSLYINAADLSSNAFAALNGGNVDDVISACKRAPILVIDDYGTETTSSDFITKIIYQIINHRYALGRDWPVFITSNKKVGEMKIHGGRTGSRMMDADFVKIYELSSVKDYRHQPKRRAQ